VPIREVIRKKRDGLQLTRGEIRETVEGYLGGAISDAQMSSLLMAIVLRGMMPQEAADLTFAMVESGTTLDLASVPGTKVDKHSTGGVGDKTTLVVAPLVASLGVPVPKMSGRALGHTGGTIDKLEAAPGLTTALSPDRFCRQVSEIGVAIAAQSEHMVPADKRIYALRDATGTVESVPLIASSVMSKKLAVGADAIVLDVKAGAGAFMPTVGRARELAEAMADIGARAGKRVAALVTRMDQPLGRTAGDAVELIEAVETLAGGGPQDFVELCAIVAGHMLAVGGAARDADEGRELARGELASGRGLDKLREMIAAQGGRDDVVDEPEALVAAAGRLPVQAGGQGYVAAVDARRVGMALRELKAEAGQHKSLCGVLLHRKTGDALGGEPAATLLFPQEAAAAAAAAADSIRSAFLVTSQRPAVGEILADIVSA
jgi:pyrimidine-nucleoside phosphorylase